MRQHPEWPPAQHLVSMWVNHFGWKKEKNHRLLEDQVLKVMSAVHGCLPHPQGAAALAIYMLSIEHPQVCAVHAKYEQRYGELMAEVIALQHSEDWDALNLRFNTVNGTPKTPVFPIQDPRVKKLMERWGIGGSAG